MSKIVVPQVNEVQFKADWEEIETDLRIRYTKIVTTIAIVALSAFIYVDYLMYPQFFWHFMSLRLLTNAYFVGIIVLLNTQFAKNNSRKILHLMYLPAILLIGWMIFYTDGAASTYYTGLMLIIIGGSLVEPLYFVDVLLVSALTIGSYVLACVLNDTIAYNMALLIRNSMVLFTAAGMIALTCYLKKNRRLSEFRLRYTLDQQLIHSNKLASIGTLVSEVGHEMKNPLQVALMNVELLKEFHQDGSLNNEENRDLIDLLSNSIMRIKSVSDGLRTYARADTEEKDLLDVHEIIENTLHLIDILYTKEGLGIERALGAEEYHVIGNSGKLQQVMLNLFSNARDAFEERSKGIIKVATSNKDNQFILEISDNGPGIKKEILDKIFLPFFTTKDKNTGTGLGLGICQEIINKMGGTIAVESEVGVGTTFLISMPLHKNEE